MAKFTTDILSYYQGLEFDGVNDYVVSSAPISPTDLTIETWIYIPGTGGSNQIAIGFGPSSTTFSYFQFRDGNEFRFIINNEPPGLSFTPNFNEWFHAAATHNSATSARTLYINGTAVDTTNSSTNPSSGVVTLGRRSGASDLYFDGRLQDVRVWNTVRTQQEIADNLNRRLDGNESNLILNYPLSEGIGDAVYDVTSNENDGTIFGATFTSQVGLKATPNTTQIAELTNYALDFGGSGDVATIPHQTYLNLQGNFTLEADLYVATGNDAQLFFKRGNGNNGYALTINSGNVEMVLLGIGTIISTPYTGFDKWTHVAVSYDGTTYRLYIDGSLVTSNTGGSPNITSEPIRIAAFTDNNGNLIGYSTQRQDEVRIWDVERSQSEISGSIGTQLSGNESGLIGYYQFDEGAGTTLIDETTNNNDASFVGATYIVR